VHQHRTLCDQIEEHVEGAVRELDEFDPSADVARAKPGRDVNDDFPQQHFACLRPHVLASPAPHEGPLATTNLDPPKARDLLLAAGLDRDAVLKAFIADGPAEL
jgi:hypothetical protein